MKENKTFGKISESGSQDYFEQMFSAKSSVSLSLFLLHTLRVCMCRSCNLCSGVISLQFRQAQRLLVTNTQKEKDKGNNERGRAEKEREGGL